MLLVMHWRISKVLGQSICYNRRNAQENNVSIRVSTTRQPTSSYMSGLTTWRLTGPKATTQLDHSNPTHLFGLSNTAHIYLICEAYMGHFGHEDHVRSAHTGPPNHTRPQPRTTQVCLEIETKVNHRCASRWSVEYFVTDHMCASLRSTGVPRKKSEAHMCFMVDRMCASS